MAKKYFVLFLVGFFLFFVNTNAFAFDGQRKGFLLGIGLGPGFTSFTQELESSGFGFHQSVKSDRETKVGLITDFKIGYAPDNTWAIYYTSKVSWFGMENTFGDNVTVSNGLGAVAVSYWFKPQAPSPFLAGGIGYSTWSLPFEDDPPDTWTGFGLFAGGGYEFSRHLSIEGSLSWGKPKREVFGIEVSSNALSFMLTINALAY
jgi:hypothetical protein